MNILAVDTSSKMLSIAVRVLPQPPKEKSYFLDRRHSSLLLPKIREILKEVKLGIRDIDIFIVGLGPGSFTGLRIGVSTVKGFGVATQRPCIGVPSLDVLAFNVNVDGCIVVPIIDAKRGNVYSAIYKKERGRFIRKTGFLLSKIEDIMKEIKGTAFFLGDGISLYRDKIENINKKIVFLNEEYWYPRADNLIELGLRKIKRYKKTTLIRLKPIYLYPKECQIKKHP